MRFNTTVVRFFLVDANRSSGETPSTLLLLVARAVTMAVIGDSGNSPIWWPRALLDPRTESVMVTVLRRSVVVLGSRHIEGIGFEGGHNCEPVGSCVGLGVDSSIRILKNQTCGNRTNHQVPSFSKKNKGSPLRRKGRHRSGTRTSFVWDHRHQRIVFSR